MKNREKYKNELIKVIKNDGKLCEFVEKHEVFQMFGKDLTSYCEMTCATCGAALQLWLDEEYEEPEVDWDNVPVDTLVRVRNSASEKWNLMYFKKFCGDYHYNKYVTWVAGRTSKTAEGHFKNWQYCELVEEEDDGSN